jgi:hypothetical protein
LFVLVAVTVVGGPTSQAEVIDRANTGMRSRSCATDLRAPRRSAWPVHIKFLMRLYGARAEGDGCAKFQLDDGDATYTEIGLPWSECRPDRAGRLLGDVEKKGMVEREHALIGGEYA